MAQQRSAMSTFARFMKLWRHPESFLRTTGQLRSFRERRPVDATGNPLPWLNFTVIDLLRDRLSPELAMLEYGSGHSTLFFASLVGRIVSVEHNAAWADEVEPQLPSNATLLRVDDKSQYATGPVDNGPFDVVLVDGIEREACLAVADQVLTANGVVLIDDSHRSAYADEIQRYQDLGFRALTLRGPKPESIVVAQTTLLYRPDNCLGI